MIESHEVIVLRFYLGPQIGLGEFEEVDISISWLETPLFMSRYTVIGSSTLAVVYSGEEEIGKVSDSKVFDLGDLKILVAVGNEATYPETFHRAAERGAKVAVIYSSASGMTDLMLFKHRSWAHAQESGMVIFGLVEVHGKVHHGVYAPMDRYEFESGIVYEGTSPGVLELEVIG